MTSLRERAAPVIVDDDDGSAFAFSASRPHGVRSEDDLGGTWTTYEEVEP